MANSEFEHILEAKEKSLTCTIKDPETDTNFKFEIFNRISLGRAQSSLLKSATLLIG